mgnify:CR=1 FL=1
MFKRRKFFLPNEPLRHNHKPVSRRDFIAQGFRTGAGTLLGVSALGMLHSSANAISPSMFSSTGYTPGDSCDLANSAGRKIPFICFDLAGGANISGSNVLVGGQGGQEDFLSTSGYSKLGLPGTMVPSVADPVTGASDFIDRRFGLAFHSDSAMLKGMLASAPSVATQQATNGAVLPARSDNDTGNNPHNPSYGVFNYLNKSGSGGSLLQLVGSQTSESGGNSMAPAAMVDPEARPTKIDRPSDVTGLVDVGDLSQVLSDPADVVSVMESMKKISDAKLDRVDTGLANQDLELKQRISCEYLKSADAYEKFARQPGDPDPLDPSADDLIVGDAGIFTRDEFNSDNEFQKTASIMKMVVNGYAAAGTITMGGYDYHTGDRVTGELRDERAGRCIGACLEYAQRIGVPLMVYVFSDGSVASNGALDMNMAIPKGQWTGDNSSTAASFFLVYNPNSQPVLNSAAGQDQDQHQQLGWMRADASVETASGYAIANSVETLAEAVVLNYMALHDNVGLFNSSQSIISDLSDLDKYIAFEPIVSGTL